MMNVRTVLVLVSCVLTIGMASAQQTIDSIIDTGLNIKRDVRLDTLTMRHIRVNELKDGIDGYRLQLFSGSGTTARQEANTLRAEFLAKHPKVPAYVVYQAPNFKVRVGDYRTELEAIWLQRELEYFFPGAFVVKDVIKFPVLEIEKEKEEDLDELEILEDDQKSSKGLDRSEEIPKKK